VVFTLSINQQHGLSINFAKDMPKNSILN